MTVCFPFVGVNDTGPTEEGSENAPVAIGTADSIRTDRSGLHPVTVEYKDDLLLDASDVGVGDIAIEFPNGEVFGATFTEKSSAVDAAKITATYLVNAPGGTWDAADNGWYIIKMRRSQVRDTMGHFVKSDDIGNFLVRIPDRERPNAIASVPMNITRGTLSNVRVAVTYSDNALVVPSGVGSTDIELVAPDGSVILPFYSEVSETKNSSTINATYGTRLSNTLTGTYTVRMRRNEVRDYSGNFVAPDVIGSFQVTSDNLKNLPPEANASVPSISPLTSDHRILITYSDDFAVDASSIDAGDIEVVSPSGRRESWELSSSPTVDASQITVAYRLEETNEGFDSLEMGTYTIRLKPGEVFDVDGEPIPAGELGSFRVAVDDQPPTPTLFVNDATQLSRVHQIVVDYTDEFSVTGIGHGDIEVVTPNGQVLHPNYSSLSGSKQSIRARYHLEWPWPSHSIFSPPENGTYIVRMKTRQVFDQSGNMIPWGEIGNFQVKFDQTCPLATAMALEVSGESIRSHDIAVTYTDESGISLAHIGPGDIEVEFPDGRAVQPEFISVDSDTDSPTVTATYRLHALRENHVLPEGKYKIRLRPNEIADTRNIRSPPAVIGSFVINVDSQSVQTVTGDVDGNGRVEFADFLVVAANFGQLVDGAFADGDFTEDGVVAFDDFLLLSNNYGFDN